MKTKKKVIKVRKHYSLDDNKIDLNKIDFSTKDNFTNKTKYENSFKIYHRHSMPLSKKTIEIFEGKKRLSNSSTNNIKRINSNIKLIGL